MPHSPQPESGRIYPAHFKSGGTVYLNKKELDARDFVQYRLAPLFGVSMMLLVALGFYLGWWAAQPQAGYKKY